MAAQCVETTHSYTLYCFNACSCGCLINTGDRSLLSGDRWNSGGSDDSAEAVRACDCQLQTQHRQTRGRPPAHPGVPYIRQQAYQLHNGGKPSYTLTYTQ